MSIVFSCPVWEKGKETLNEMKGALFSHLAQIHFFIFLLCNFYKNVKRTKMKNFEVKSFISEAVKVERLPLRMSSKYIEVVEEMKKQFKINQWYKLKKLSMNSSTLRTGLRSTANKLHVNLDIKQINKHLYVRIIDFEKEEVQRTSRPRTYKKSRRNKNWSKEEDKKVQEFYQKGYTVPRISRELKRTEKAVYQRINKLVFIGSIKK